VGGGRRRPRRTHPASRALAAVAVIGGLLYVGSAPLVIATGNPAFTALFPLQAGLAVWLVGTGVTLFQPVGDALRPR